MNRPPLRRQAAVRVEGRTLVHQSGLRLRLEWSAARSLAEAICSALAQLRPIQVGAYGWVIRSTGGPRVQLTRAAAANVGKALANSGRLEACRG